jgi:hypothetical protein
MTGRFKIGDHVSCNTRRASQDDPQYEIKSDKTDHVAAHKGSALTLA